MLSHWLLDFIAHRPDLPLWPGSPLFGLGLWNSLAASIVVELAIFGAGVWIYTRATRPRDAIGHWAWWGFVVVLAGIYGASVFGPPPPSEKALTWTGLAGWLFVVWAYWIGWHRMPVR